MRQLTRFSCIVLSASLLLACSDHSDSPPDIPEPPVAPPIVVESIFTQQTVDLPSVATPAFTPGSPGVVVSNANLITHFGSSDINLNNARYTRYYLSDQNTSQPDAILVAIPGFEEGASSFFILVENLIRRAIEQDNLVLEVWAVDRRFNQLEDTVELDIAEGLDEAIVGLDFLFGDALGMELGPALVEGPNRRAVFYNSHVDTALMAQVPQLNVLTVLLGIGAASSTTLLGKFLDDDGLTASVANFLATSAGFEGPVVNGGHTWLSKGEEIPAAAFVDNGPAPELIADIGPLLAFIGRNLQWALSPIHEASQIELHRFPNRLLNGFRHPA